MFDISRLLIQFVFRVTFGLALAMRLTSPQQVTSGYFQKHLWVLMGLNTLATLALLPLQGKAVEWMVNPKLILALAGLLAFGSYVGSVCWLAERKRGGQWALQWVSIGGLVASTLTTVVAGGMRGLPGVLAICDVTTGGALLGVILAAMFLGHWYLNHPSMKLAPLQNLVALLGVAVVARAVVGAVGLWLRVATAAGLPSEFWIFLSLRWLAGILGLLIIAWATWQTLKVPNTQSATGLLYAGVILAFIGELTSQLMSVSERFPV